MKEKSKKNDWAKFDNQIEELKRAYKDNQDDFLTLQCIYFYDDEYPKNFEYYISGYNQKDLQFKYEIKKNRLWELDFPGKIFSDIIKELAQKIFPKIEEIYNSVKAERIILTRAGSNNKVLIDYICCLAEEKNILLDTITPPQPEISIMKGAVLFGFQNDIIRKRKAKYTLGIKSAYEWKEKY